MRYLLFATVGTVLFFGTYWLLMRRETRFTMVRFYLLGTLLLALILPLIHLPLQIPTNYHNSSSESPILQEYTTTAESITMTIANQQGGTNNVTLRQDPTGLRTINIEQGPTYSTVERRNKALSLLTYIYLLGCAAMAVVLVRRLVLLHSRLRRLPYRMVDGIRVSELDNDTPAYSFGNHIVLGRNGFNPSELNQLLGHEMVHVRQHHTLDLLLCELAKVFLWFNPFVWLYSRELKRVHEYIADHEMLSADHGADYAALFYHQLSGRPYSPIGNTFDYRLVRQRIGMMSQRRSRRGWLKPLAVLPLVAVMLVAGCKQEGTLKGFYSVSNMALMSDNPAEPNLTCSEFFGLENRLFCFHRDGRVHILDRQEKDSSQLCTYIIDDQGLHLFDSTGQPWLDMQLETLHCDDDSIVLRFVDADPITGLGKMLAGLPSYRFRIDTVEVSTTTKVGDEIIEVSQGTRCDTSFAHVVVPCEYENNINWNRDNRLLGTTTDGVTTFVHQYETKLGKKVEEFGTEWEFQNNAMVPDARLRYDTTSYYNPRLEGDRFILEVTLKRQRNKN